MNTETAVRLLDLLRTGREGIEYIRNCLEQDRMSQTAAAVLDSLSELVSAVEQRVETEHTPNRVKEINENIRFYLDRIQREISEDPDAFAFDFRFHLQSLYRLLEYEIAYLAEHAADKTQYPDFYPEVGEVDHEKILEQGRHAKHLVSIVVLAYNNLSSTRDCVESILKNTKGIDYELILVDNGSKDGTKAFFDSVEGAKVISLKYNLHIVKGFNIGMMAAEGKYCAAVGNDFVFPENWLSNLLTCIESDPAIGYVSPGATNISNLQQISIPFTSIAEFEGKAREYNVSDPRKWEDRVVLLPDVLCCPTVLLERIGYYDTHYYRGEFGDDDISFRIRRAGYRLVYCGDTVTYHHGSLTTESDHKTGSLEEGRRTFFERYHVDAWLDARPDALFLNLLYDGFSQVNSILGIGVKCGATLLQIKNIIWGRFGVRPALISVSVEKKYMTDLKTISDKTYFSENLASVPETVGGKFDIIFIEEPLNYFSEDLKTIFLSLTRMLNDNGVLIFRLNNYAGLNAILGLFSASETLNSKKIYLESSVCALARQYGFTQLYKIDALLNQTEMVKSTVEKISQALSNRAEDRNALERILLKECSVFQMTYHPDSSQQC